MHPHVGNRIAATCSRDPYCSSSSARRMRDSHKTSPNRYYSSETLYPKIRAWVSQKANQLERDIPGTPGGGKSSPSPVLNTSNPLVGPRVHAARSSPPDSDPVIPAHPGNCFTAGGGRCGCRRRRSQVAATPDQVCRTIDVPPETSASSSESAIPHIGAGISIASVNPRPGRVPQKVTCLLTVHGQHSSLEPSLFRPRAPAHCGELRRATRPMWLPLRIPRICSSARPA